MTERERSRAGQRTRARWRWAAIAAALGLSAAGLVAACTGGQRFPVCRSNADCGERDGGSEAPVCFNLRCVGCRYDTDCASGEACNAGNRCEPISSSGAEPEDADAVPWDPSSWKECAERCKDQACIKACTERFEQ